MLLALQHLHQEEKEKANAAAQAAMSHFDSSGFPEDVKRFIKTVIETPQRVLPVAKRHHHSPSPLHALDCILIHGVKS